MGTSGRKAFLEHALATGKRQKAEAKISPDPGPPPHLALRQRPPII